MNYDDSICTQQLILRDNNRTAMAYFQFVDGDLEVSVSSDDGKEQYDFNVRADTLSLLADAYKRHLKVYLDSL